MTSTAEGTVAIRPAGVDDFASVYPLLLDFGNTHLTADDWRRMLFAYGWSSSDQRGYLLLADDVPVGFLGTIVSERRIDGRTERFCNASSWIVREPFRAASILLVKSLLSMRDCTLLNLTPTRRSYDIFAKLGFRELEREQLHFLPAPATFARVLHGSFTSDPSVLEARLADEERAIFGHLRAWSRTAHVLLSVRDRHCYVVATPLYRKGLKLAQVHYVGNPDVFFAHQALAYVAIARTMGAAGFVMDARLADGHDVGPSLRKPARRLYRPARPSITPRQVDNLYSELMVHEHL